MSIRDDFFANKAVGALWDVAVSIKRGNPLPLDSNSVFESYEALETYASGVLAYPGQVVAVVNADSTGIYYLDQDLAIKEVGSVPVADDKSIVVKDGIISLHDYGSAYYKYVPEVINEETQEKTPAHYERVEVSDSNIWAAGLEPKVVSENGQFVIGWFEPNPTTIEGVQDQVTAIQTSVSDLQKVTGDLQIAVGAPADEEKGTAASGIFTELDKKANANDVYTKTETDKKIADAVAEADHLKRKIVTSLEEAKQYAANNDDATQYIFMVPTGLEYDSDKYDEYIVLVETDPDTAAEVRILEKVGAWEVDLSDYAKTTYVNTELEKKVDAVEGSRLITDEEAAKLESINPEAANLISNINETDFTITDGTLNLNTIAQSKVEGLEDALNGLVAKEDGKGLSTNDFTNELKEKLDTLDLTAISDMQTAVGNLGTSLENAEKAIEDLKQVTGDLDTTYVSIENFEAIVGDIETLLAEGFNVKTKIDNAELDIAKLYEILTWVEMSEEEPTENE